MQSTTSPIRRNPPIKENTVTDQGPREEETGIMESGTGSLFEKHSVRQDMPPSGGGYTIGTPPPPELPNPFGPSARTGPAPEERSLWDRFKDPEGPVEGSMVIFAIFGMVAALIVGVGLLYGASRYYLGDDRDPFAAPSANVEQLLNCNGGMATLRVDVPKGGNPVSVNLTGTDVNGAIVDTVGVAREGDPFVKSFQYQTFGSEYVPTVQFDLTNTGTGGVHTEYFVPINSTDCPAPTPVPEPTIEVAAQGRSNAENVGTPGIIGDVDDGITVQQFFADGTPGEVLHEVGRGNKLNAAVPCGSVWAMNPDGERIAQIVVPDQLQCSQSASVAPGGQAAQAVQPMKGGDLAELTCFDPTYASSTGGSLYEFGLAPGQSQYFSISPRIAGYDSNVAWEWEVLLDGRFYTNADQDTASIQIPLSIVKAAEPSTFIVRAVPVDGKLMNYVTIPCTYSITLEEGQGS